MPGVAILAALVNAGWKRGGGGLINLHRDFREAVFALHFVSLLRMSEDCLSMRGDWTGARNWRDSAIKFQEKILSA